MMFGEDCHRHSGLGEKMVRRKPQKGLHNGTLSGARERERTLSTGTWEQWGWGVVRQWLSN
jgi:hypothetical protein